MRIHFGIVLAITVSVGYVGRLMMSQGEMSGPPICPLEVDTDTVDFGMAWSQPSFPWSVRVRNKTNRGCELTRVIPSCACTVAQLPDQAIPAYGFGEIKLVLGLDTQSAELAKSSRPVDFNSELTVTVRGNPSPLRLTVRGRVQPNPLQHAPSALSLGEWLPNSTPKSVVCEFGIDERIDGLRVIQVEPEIGEVTVAFADGLAAMTVTPRSGLPRGSVRFAIDLEATLPAPLPTARRRVWCEGRVTPQVELDRTSVLGGIVAVGEQRQETLTIRSTSDMKFCVDRIESGDPAIMVTEVPPAWTTENPIHVQLCPTRPGQYRHPLRLCLRMENDDPVDLTCLIQFIAVDSEAE